MSKSSKHSKQVKPEQRSQMCVWDMTIYPSLASDPDYLNKCDEDINHIRRIFTLHTKKYTFQLEQGEKKKLFHYQVRISLQVKAFENKVVSLFKEDFGSLKFSFKVLLTSSACRKDTFYVTKADTRILGPFTDENYVYIPRDVANMKILRPFQQSVVNILNNYDERKINCIVTFSGNLGKTRLCRYLMIHCGAMILPIGKDYRDVLRMAYDVGKKPVYLVDMPRAFPKKSLAEFFGALETLKSGYSFDDRNCFKYRLFDPPRILLFTNTIPNMEWLSQDMWEFNTISEDGQHLLPFNPHNPLGEFDSLDEDATDVEILTHVEAKREKKRRQK